MVPSGWAKAILAPKQTILQFKRVPPVKARNSPTEQMHVRICDIRPSKGKQALDVYNLQLN